MNAIQDIQALDLETRNKLEAAIAEMIAAGLGELLAGGGLTRTGDTFDVGAGDGIQVDADVVTVKLDGVSLAKGGAGLKVSPSLAVDLGAAAASQDVDLSLGTYFHGTVDVGVTFTFSNPPVSGEVFQFMLELTKDATGTARTLTFPAAVKGDIIPSSLTVSGQKMLLGLTTRDGGATWALAVMQNNFA